jgi:hypothetical protein
MSVAEKRRQAEERKRDEMEEKLREKEEKQKQVLLDQKKKRDHGAQAAHRAFQAQRDHHQDKAKKKPADIGNAAKEKGKDKGGAVVKGAYVYVGIWVKGQGSRLKG